MWVLIACLILIVDIVILRRWQRVPIIIATVAIPLHIAIVKYFSAFIKQLANTVFAPWLLFLKVILLPFHLTLIVVIAYAFGFSKWTSKERMIYGVLVGCHMGLVLWLILVPNRC